MRSLTLAPHIIAFFLVGFLRHAITGGDIWVRMASGRLVLEKHAIPHSDPFSFTALGGRWIDNEWVMGVLLYLLYSVHYELVVVVFGALAIAPFALMHWHALRAGGSPLSTAGVVAVAIASAWRNFPPRGALVNPLFFAILLILVDTHRSRRPVVGSGRFTVPLVAAAVPLMLVWANVQGGFLAGIAALAVWTAACLLERRDRLLAFSITFASAAVALLNAYGWHLYEYALQAIATNNPDHQNVQEWLSPDFHSPLNWPMLPAIALAVYFGVRRLDVFRQMLLLGTLVAALTSMRYDPFFAVALILVIAPLVKATTAPTPRTVRFLRFLTIPVAAAAAALFLLTIGASPTRTEATAGLAFLRGHCPNEHVLASIDFSSWLVYEKFPVFIDGRTNQVYPDELIQDYFELSQTKGDWERTLDKYEINVVMFEKNSSLADALIARGWTQAFEGDVEVVLNRPGAGCGT